MYVAYMAFPVGVIIAFIYPLFEMSFRRWLLIFLDVGSDPQWPMSPSKGDHTCVKIVKCWRVTDVNQL